MPTGNPLWERPVTIREVPRARPISHLTSHIKNNTIDGEEIAKFMIVVKRKDEADVKTATTCERIDAAHWLTERCVHAFENQAPTSMTMEAIPMPVTPCQQRSAVH